MKDTEDSPDNSDHTNLDEKSECTVANLDEQEESEGSKSELQTNLKKQPTKKLKPRITIMDNVVNTLQTYAKSGNKRKLRMFKYRQYNFAASMYRKKKILSTPRFKKVSKKNSTIHNAELEMATITSLREMYFNRPIILKEFEEIRTEKETTGRKTGAVVRTSVLIPYLDKYKPKKEEEIFFKLPNKSKVLEYDEKKAKVQKSRDAIRNGYVVSVFNIDDDNLFTDNELHKIERMKPETSLREKRGPNDVTKEIWEWNEFVNHLPNFSATKDETSELSYGTEELGKARPEPERRMQHHLLNWFQQTSPPVESKDLIHKFKYYDTLYQKEYTFLTVESRLKAAIKFLKFAKIVYPDFQCMKVLKELQDYIGPVTLDELQAQTRTTGSVLKRPKKKLRYFRKLLKETKELENMFVDPEIEAEVKVDLKKEERPPESLEEYEGHLKNALEKIGFGNVYDEYVESCLPFPFNDYFIKIANGLLKYHVYISNNTDIKGHEKEIFHLVGRILELILASMKLVIDTIFKTNAPFDFPEYGKTEKVILGEESRAPEVPKEGMDHAVKKLMVYMIKYMNLNNIFQNKDREISSSECQSLSCISSDEEKKHSKKV